MEPINYGLIHARVLGRLKRNWKIRAAWRRTRILKQVSNLRLPLLASPADDAASPLRGSASKRPTGGAGPVFPALGMSASLGSFKLR